VLNGWVRNVVFDSLNCVARFDTCMNVVAVNNRLIGKQVRDVDPHVPCVSHCPFPFGPLATRPPPCHVTHCGSMNMQGHAGFLSLRSYGNLFRDNTDQVDVGQFHGPGVQV
jgi:hypothetical protein